jgi:L-lactate dehydrogenase
MPSSIARANRIAVIGAGNVGVTFAYSLMHSGLASEIVLLDLDKKRTEGEVMDLNHAVPYLRTVAVWCGDYEDVAGAAVTVISAGVGQKPGESRLELLKRNVDVFQKIVPKVVENNPDGIILIATNPVDILTYVTQKISGLPKERVIGSGTILDTARFRYLLGQHFRVDAQSVHAYIIGEHGDSEVPVWSTADIGSLKVEEFAKGYQISFDDKVKEEIFTKTRDAAYHIIERKGATYYAVAVGLVRIVEAVLRDQKTVLSVSSLIEPEYECVSDVSLSLPSVISRAGIEKVLRLKLCEEEASALCHSADVLKETLGQLEV